MVNLTKWQFAYEKSTPNGVCPACGSHWFLVYKQEKPRSVVFKTICRNCKQEE